MSSMWAIGAFQARYQAVTDKMNVWDTERISENLNIRDVSRIVEVLKSGVKWYNLTIFVDNNGGVTVNIARIYVLDQDLNKLYTIDPNALTAIPPTLGFLSRNSTINTGEVSRLILVSEPEITQGTPGALASALKASHKCRIILATDRGRQFSYSYPSSSGSGGGGYAIIIDDASENFQYAAGNMMAFQSATVKVKGTDHTLYRVKIRNTTDKLILLTNKCEMLHMTGAQGQATPRWIVSPANLNRLPTGNIPLDGLTVFSTQSIASGASEYIYLAASAVGGTTFLSEPGQGDYLVSFILYFKYDGETEERNIPMPAMPQELTAN